MSEEAATNAGKARKATKRNRVAYAEAHKELKTRVGFALTFMRKAINGDGPAVCKAMIESAVEILEGKE